MSVAERGSSRRPPATPEPVASYVERLARRMAAVRSCLCLGVDPDPDALPEGFERGVAGVEHFARLLLDTGLERAAAVKVNVAFFEAFGSAGIAALERVRAQVPSDVPFIADAKRGDISSTAARQATALYDVLGADAVTASPYLGGEAIAPLLERTERFVYVLCRTSNPGAGEIQGLDVGGEPLYIRVAQRAAAWVGERGNVGLVVGATAPAELEAVRAVAPQLPFLVPGVGAQGGDAEAVMRHGRATSGPASAAAGGALLVNVSRGIASAALETDQPERQLASAAARWSDLLRC